MDVPDTAKGKRLEADALEERAYELTKQATTLRLLANEQSGGPKTVTCTCGCGATRIDDGSVT